MTTYRGSEGVQRLSRDLARVPTELRPRIRTALLRSGTELRDLAAANAAAWSSRIPGALKVRPRFAGARAGVYVVASRRAAPHARPLEGITGNATFRHPVRGSDAWVTQATRPYLAPAVGAEADRAVDGLNDALLQALRVAGFG